MSPERLFQGGPLIVGQPPRPLPSFERQHLPDCSAPTSKHSPTADRDSHSYLLHASRKYFNSRTTVTLSDAPTASSFDDTMSLLQAVPTARSSIFPPNHHMTGSFEADEALEPRDADSVWKIVIPRLAHYVDATDLMAIRQISRIFAEHKWFPAEIDLAACRGYEGRTIIEEVITPILEHVVDENTPPFAVNLGCCTLLRDSAVTRLLDVCAPRIRSLSLDFCYQMTDKGIQALLKTPMPALERLSLRCARNKLLIGQPFSDHLCPQRWPRFHKFNCAFTSLWLEHLETVAAVITRNAAELGTLPKLEMSGSWASRCLLESLGLHQHVRQFSQAVRLRVADTCGKLAKRVKQSVLEASEKAETAALSHRADHTDKSSASKGGDPVVRSVVVSLVKYQGDQILVNLPCTQNTTHMRSLNDTSGTQGSVPEEQEELMWWTHPLSIAIEGRDAATMTVLLRHGAKVDVWDFLGHSPLYLACKTDQEDIVECLLEHGASATPYDLLGSTPLRVAIENGNVEIVELLLNHGAEVNHNVRVRGFKSPLFIACEKNAVECIQLLLARQADPNWTDRAKYSPTLLSYQWSSSWLPKFLEAGAGRDVKHRGVLTDVLTCGILKGDLSCVKLLSQRYPDLLEAPHPMWSLPHIEAAKLGRIEILRYLLEAGSNINAKGPDGGAAIHAAAEEGSLEAIMVLLSAHSHLDAKKVVYVTADVSPGVMVSAEASEIGNHSLHAQAKSADGSVADLRHLERCNIDLQDAEGRTALFIACAENRRNVAEALLRKGADVNIQTSGSGENALMACIRMRNELMALLLLKFSADIQFDQQDKRGRTALMYAIYFGQFLIADKLLLRGADVTLKNDEGQSAYSIMLDRIQKGPNQQTQLCKRVAKLYRSAAASQSRHSTEGSSGNQKDSGSADGSSPRYQHARRQDKSQDRNTSQQPISDRSRRSRAFQRHFPACLGGGGWLRRR